MNLVSQLDAHHVKDKFEILGRQIVPVHLSFDSAALTSDTADFYVHRETRDNFFVPIPPSKDQLMYTQIHKRQIQIEPDREGDND